MIKEIDWFAKPTDGSIKEIVDRVDRRKITEKGKVFSKLGGDFNGK